VDKLRQAEIKIVYDDDSNKKVKCPKFSGNGGIEELMLIVEMFDDLCSDLRVPQDEKFTHFKTVLEHGPRNKWKTLEPDTNYTQDEDGFKECISAFYLKYAAAKDARDVFIKYLESSKVAKREDVTIDAHVERIETLCRYANRLHGTGSLLLDANKKAILFHSFPETWTDTINRGAVHFSDMKSEEIVQAMMKEQAHAIKQAARRGQQKHRKRKQDGDGDGYQNKRRGGGGRGGGRDRKRGGHGSGRDRGGKKPAADPEAKCRIPHHNHKWKDCTENFWGPNFVPKNRGGRGGHGGRGGGGGRGNSGGRGNFGGRGDYHQQSYHTQGYGYPPPPPGPYQQQPGGQPHYPALPPSQGSETHHYGSYQQQQPSYNPYGRGG